MLNFKHQIQKRREDVLSAYYIDGLSIELISKYSGHKIATIKKDLKYIEDNLEEFNSCMLPEEILEKAEDKY